MRKKSTRSEFTTVEIKKETHQKLVEKSLKTGIKIGHLATEIIAEKLAEKLKT